MTIRSLKISIISLFIVFILVFSGCAKQPAAAPAKKTHFALDTIIDISIYDGEKRDVVLNGCMDLIDRYEKLLSRTLEGSDIWRINHANGERIDVSPETADILTIALKYCALSDGGFDITIQPVSALWNFTKPPYSLPDKAAIDQAIKLVDYHQISLKGNTVQLADKKGGLDLGGIAKGYIADRIVDYLKSQNVSSALINLGGNVVVMGGRPDGSPWRVGVQGAFEERNSPIAMFSVRNMSVVTSGIYERSFVLDGKSYHHILDTKTGYPIDNELAAVTILSEKSVDGDALAKFGFTMDRQAAISVIQGLGCEAVFIDRSGNITFTSGIGTSEKAKYTIKLLK